MSETSQQHKDQNYQLLVGRMQDLREQYLNAEAMFALIYENNPSRLALLTQMDALERIIYTALSFGQYRRAVRYIVVYEKICAELFG